MRSFNLIAGLTALLVTSGSAQQNPPLPANDPFYVQPANISAYKPGDIIRLRSTGTSIQGPPVLTGGPDSTYQVKSSTQFLYRTTDSLGNSVAAVATFIVPNNFQANSSRLLAYSTAYDSANNNCSPSFALRPGANNTISADYIALTTALNNGWYVVTSDYEGLQAQFVAGIQSGHGVLDSIRASFNRSAIATTGLSPNAVYTMFGYSGGSLASEWASELAPTYAPDLNRFLGTAIGGLTPNVTNVFISVNGTTAAGLAFAGSLGLSKAYSNLSNYLFNEQLLPNKRAEYFNLATRCPNDTDGGYGTLAANMNIYNYFKDGRAILDSNIWKTVTSGAGQQGVHGIPKQPFYIYKGTADEISPVVDTDQLVDKYCRAGVTINYRRLVGASHGGAAIDDTLNAFGWLSDRYAGKPIQQQNNLNNCQISNITVIPSSDASQNASTSNAGEGF